MSRVRAAFSKLQDYCKTNNPDSLKSLGPPATDNDIKELEKLLPTPMRLPLGYVELLKLHNGNYFVIGGWEFLNIKHVIREWNMWQKLFPMDHPENRGHAKPEAGVKNFWYNSRWVPIMGDSSGNFICIDYDPASGGRSGQIIEMWHDWDQRKRVAATFDDWLVAEVDRHIEATEKAKAAAEKADDDAKRKAKLPVWLRWVLK